MMMRILRFRDLGSDRRGTAAIEFAFVGLFTLELILEAMQAGLYFYTSAGVERATMTSARQIMTGAVSAQGMTAAQFRTNVLCPPIAATNLSCSNLITNVQVVNEGTSPGGFYTLVNAAQTGLVQPSLNNSQNTFCIGTAGSYVAVQIIYAMPVFSPIWRAFATSFNGTPSFLLQTTAAFKNEPFLPGNTPC